MTDRQPAAPDVIAIDGPAASGKTTIGSLLADRLGYYFLDTGNMYRAATLAVLEAGVSPADEAAVVAIAAAIAIDVQACLDPDGRRHYTVLLDGRDVTQDIRSLAVDRHVSQVSAYPDVRRVMVARQQELAARGRIVVVGRDIGTVVLPDAPLKLYLVASIEERARRRWQELRDKGVDADLDEVLSEMVRRDAHDGGRVHSPLRPAEDAIFVDTTGHSAAEVVAAILSHDPV